MWTHLKKPNHDSYTPIYRVACADQLMKDTVLVFDYFPNKLIMMWCFVVSRKCCSDINQLKISRTQSTSCRSTFWHVSGNCRSWQGSYTQKYDIVFSWAECVLLPVNTWLSHPTHLHSWAQVQTFDFWLSSVTKLNLRTKVAAKLQCKLNKF